MSSSPIALALHGGAGARRDRDYAPHIAEMRGLIETGRDRLAAGASALDVVVDIAVALEESGRYVAGRGASPNTSGRYELDAALMDGSIRKAGAVAALEGFRNPIRAAEAVMTRTPHVLLVGVGAREFAAGQKLETLPAPPHEYYLATDRDVAGNELAHGTIGCVALDQAGRLAAATSTAGVFNKMAGRVGDCPLIGAGTWADGEVAVSCTGLGEFFIRAAAAHQLAARLAFSNQGLVEAADAVIADVGALGGDGGLIAVDRLGKIAMPFDGEGMKRACLHPDGRIEAAVF